MTASQRVIAIIDRSYSRQSLILKRPHSTRVSYGAGGSGLRRGRSFANSGSHQYGGLGRTKSIPAARSTYGR